MLAKKLKHLKFKLIDWNRNVFGHLDTRMFGLLEKVKVWDAKEQQLTLTHDDRIERFKLKKELAMMRSWKDIFWRQRAKQQWIQHGDRNTKFFHRVANNRRKFNAIGNIKVNGQVATSFR